ADSTCLDGNGTAMTADAGGCIGDPIRKGCGAHGGGDLRESEFLPIPTLPEHPPPSNQEEPGKTLPSVKLENPNLPGFGTVPLRGDRPKVGRLSPTELDS